jgi:hypothetical protein
VRPALALCLLFLVQAAAGSATIDVTVLDETGRPVATLTAADFEVRLDGQKRVVRSAEYVQLVESMAGAVGPAFDASPVAGSVTAVYRIVLDAPASPSSTSDTALAVTVPKRPGSTVRARFHASSPSPPAAPPASPPLVTPEQQMRRAIVSGRTLDGLAVTLTSTLRRADDPSQIAIAVAVNVASAHGPLRTVFGLVDAAGKLRTSDATVEQAETDGSYRLRFTVPVTPGTYKLRLAALDTAGAVGAAEISVNASLTPIGPLQASDLTVEPLRGEGRRILATLDLYRGAGAAPPDVIVKMALVAAAGEVAAERVVVPDASDGAWHVEAEFALDRVPAGAYTVRATVLSGATVLGAVSRRVP